jgi:hypothetical protein
MYEILLFEAGAEHSPIWWKNFTHSTGKPSTFSTKELNDWLEPYGIYFFTRPARKASGDPYGDRYLRFNSEEECAFFILKWS